MCAPSSSSSTEFAPTIGRSTPFASPACSSPGSPVKTCLTAAGSLSITQVSSFWIRSVNASP